MPPLIKRINRKFDKTHLRLITRALLDYMLAEDLAAEDVSPDEELVQILLPSLEKKSSIWNHLKDNIEFVGSTAHKHFVSHLKN